ncbi:hypothetical protein Pfo_013576, partial [Paulownia fortunei]
TTVLPQNAYHIRTLSRDLSKLSKLLPNCEMRCINCRSLPSPFLSEHNYKHQIWLANKPSILQVNRIGFSLVLSLRTRALPSPIFFAATSPVTGKLSVLLQTSAVCLFAYWVANFVVPNIILKDLQSNKTNEDGENPGEDE